MHEEKRSADGDLGVDCWRRVVQDLLDHFVHEVLCIGLVGLIVQDGVAQLHSTLAVTLRQNCQRQGHHDAAHESLERSHLCSQRLSGRLYRDVRRFGFRSQKLPAQTCQRYECKHSGHRYRERFVHNAQHKIEACLGSRRRCVEASGHALAVQRVEGQSMAQGRRVEARSQGLPVCLQVDERRRRSLNPDV